MANVKKQQTTTTTTSKKEKNTYKCISCGEPYTDPRNFFSTKSSIYKFNNFRVTICKKCIERLFESYKARYNDVYYAFYHICVITGWYYSEEAFRSALGDDIDTIGCYVSRMSVGRCKGKTFDTNLMEDFNFKNKPPVVESTYHGDSEELEEIRKQMKQRWGNGLTDDDYEFLEQEYDQWSTMYNCGEKNMQTLIEEICLTKLTIRKKRAAGEPVDKDQKSLQDFMGSCNLKPMQETGANAAEQSTFGNFIKHIENDRPIPEPEDEFKDVDNILKYIRIWFVGHLAKIFGKDNEYSTEYELEREKYTVSVPEVEDDI